MKACIYMIFVISVFGVAHSLKKNNKPRKQAVRNDEPNLAGLTSKVETLQTLTKSLVSQIESGSKQMQILVNENSILKTGMQKQQNAIDILQQKTVDIGTYAEYMQFGCLNDFITLTCPTGKYIELTKAYYGQYAETCPDPENACCIPQSNDCVESVALGRPGDWLELQILCDNRSSCSFEYRGSTVDNCTLDYIGDYMSVFFQCLPELDSDPVAFTVYAGRTRQFALGESVIFDGVVTNQGGHFATIENSFTCPFDGIYIFMANLAHDESNSTLSSAADIMMDGLILVTVPFDTHGSNNCIVQCLSGQKVWVEIKSNDNSFLHGDPVNRYTTFSGTMLYTY